MWTPITIILGSILVTTSIIVLAALINKVADHFDDVANMFFAVQVMQLRLELDELGYEVPDWLKVMDEEEQPLDMSPPTELRSIKLEKDSLVE